MSDKSVSMVVLLLSIGIDSDIFPSFVLFEVDEESGLSLPGLLSSIDNDTDELFSSVACDGDDEFVSVSRLSEVRVCEKL